MLGFFAINFPVKEGDSVSPLTKASMYNTLLINSIQNHEEMFQVITNHNSTIIWQGGVFHFGFTGEKT